MIQILAISGSLRAGSSNTAVLEAAARFAAPGVQVTLYRDLALLPPFNPDLDDEALPPIAAAWRGAIGKADALLLSSPEYAGSIAGVMKNALDWLVRGEEFYRKPVGIINASPRASTALAHLRLVLQTMSATLVEPACVTVPMLGRQPDEPMLFDAGGELAATLRGVTSALAEAAQPNYP